MARIAVAGAGLGGLSAAVRLAAAGHDVVVCEQADEVGGKAGWFTRDGFGFDTGPSLVTLPAVYRDLFATTGPPLERCLDLVPVEPAARYRFPDGTWVDVPGASRAGVAAAFDDAFGGTAGAQWSSLLRYASNVWDLTRGPFLESALQGPRTLLSLARDTRALRTVAPWRSLRAAGARHLQDPRLRMFLDRYATYSGSDPRRAPAALVTVPYVEQAFGSWYVTGGLHRLVQATADRARELGVTIHTGWEVDRVVVTDGRAAGLLATDGRRVDADVVVSGLDAALLYDRLMPDPLPAPVRRGVRAARRRLRSTTPSSSGFVLLLALRGRTPDLAHHTVLFAEDYDDEFDALFGTGRRRGHPAPIPEPTVYISAPDDPATRPDEDHEAWFVLVNAPRHDPSGRAGIDWDAAGLADRTADAVLATMARRGLDVRDRVLWREVRTPADLERSTGSPGGSIYGTSSNGARSAFLRPANRSPVPGLFLVGGSSHPGGGLPLVGLSAAIVADLIGPA